MLRRLLAVAVFVALAGLLVIFAVPGGSAAAERRCGALSGGPTAPKAIRALRVSCRRARRVASRHASEGGRAGRCSIGRPSCRIDGWSCRRTSVEGPDTRIRCRRGERRVRFVYGV